MAKRISAVFLAAALAGTSHRAAWAGEAAVKQVRFLHISDTHAQLDTHWEYMPEDAGRLRRMGGYARLKTALDERRKSAPGAVFTIDGGDTFQGSAIGAWTRGEAVLGPLNALGIDVGTPGNWEVVYGPEQFKSLMGRVNYRVVCYNFHDIKTGRRLFAPAAVLEKAGVRVAFVGVTDPTTTERQPPAEVAGLDSTRLAGLRDFVRDLKVREKPGLTVLVDHTGLAPSVQLAKNIPELDIVLSGHTHERVYKPIRVGRTLVVEPGSMESFMGQLDVSVRDGRVVDAHYELVNIDADRYAEDPAVKKLIARAEKPYRSRLRAVVGRTNTPLMRYDTLETTMDDFVSDAVREATGADIGFTNGFRFSPPIAAGPITEADLWNVLPLDARLKAGTATGAHLKQYLEHEMELVFAQDPFRLSGGWGPRASGMDVVFRARAPIGRRIEAVTIQGRPLDPHKVYSLGGCEREGEPMPTICRMRETQNAHYVEGTVHAALRAYLQKHSPLNYRREGRVHAADLPPTVWSQYGALQEMWRLPGSAAAVALPNARRAP